MPRFIPTRSGAGIPAIQDTAKERIVATFFIDKDAPDAAETIISHKKTPHFHENNRNT